MGSARAGRRASCRTHVMREGETISYFYNMRACNYYTARPSRRHRGARRLGVTLLAPYIPVDVGSAQEGKYRASTASQTCGSARVS